jgi:hypothetical protein
VKLVTERPMSFTEFVLSSPPPKYKHPHKRAGRPKLPSPYQAAAEAIIAAVASREMIAA